MISRLDTLDNHLTNIISNLSDDNHINFLLKQYGLEFTHFTLLKVLDLHIKETTKILQDIHTALKEALKE